MRYHLTLPPNIRLDAALAEKFSEFLSRSRVQKLIKEGHVLVEGAPCLRPAYKSEIEHPVEFEYEPEPDYELKPLNLNIPILYQDDDIAIVHKPAGMTVHPGAGTRDDTLVHSLKAQLDHLSEGSEELRPGIVHRLDRETEGLMVIAKKNLSHRLLAEAFENRKITKEYHAWVWGQTPEAEELSGFMGRHPSDRKRMFFIPDDELSKKKGQARESEHLKKALLSYITLRRTAHFSLVKIQLHTGRTHQIRASFSHFGLSVVGDSLYCRTSRKAKTAGFSQAQVEDLNSRGMLLIASRLAFEHPVTSQKIDYSLPLPERFDNLEA